MCNESDNTDSSGVRNVWIDLDVKGIISSVHSKEKHTIWNKRKKNVPLDGEQFEWNIEQYESDGIPIDQVYTQIAPVSVNENRNENHNTIKLDPLKLIVLDTGLWGAYKRPREYQGKKGGPQRDFGLVENGHVWLAQYVSALNKKAKLKDITEKTCKELDKKGVRLAHKLAGIVHEGGMGAIELLKYAKADEATMTSETKKNMYICLPDLHLSDKWPDLPREDERHKDKNACRRLQKILRDCQRWPGSIFGNKISRDHAKRVQKYIEELEDKGFTKKWREGNRHSHDFEGMGEFCITYKKTKKLTKQKRVVGISAMEFLAEKDIVDRALRIHSTWFCGPGKKYVDEGRHTSEPPYGKKDDLLYKTLKDEAPGDAGPAFDLVNLLVAVRELHKQKVKTEGDVKVWQAGDMCEMWMNHEFLYHGFWVRKTGQGGATARMGIRRAAKGFINPKCEDFQARKDEYHYHPEGRKITEHGFTLEKARKAKWYTYNHMNTKEQKFRHVVGDMIKDEYYSGNKLEELEKSFNLPNNEINRRRYLLKKRMDSILNFSLPFSDKAAHEIAIKWNTKKEDYLAKFYEEYLGKNLERRYRHKYFNFEEDANKGYTKKKKWANETYTEVYWNKLIWYLFTKVEGEAVYGNHDGYRGDPLLCHDENLEKKYQSKGWISRPGLWCEHAHRWDEYNRDGCAFGQGGTNMAYYYMHQLGGLSKTGKIAKKLEAGFTKGRDKMEAGAAIWFLLLRVHSIKKLSWFKDNDEKLYPFGIYICGHSHGAELASVRLKTTNILLGDKRIEVDDKRKGGGFSRARPYLYKSQDLAAHEAKMYEAQQVDGKNNEELKWLKKRN